MQIIHPVLGRQVQYLPSYRHSNRHSRYLYSPSYIIASTTVGSTIPTGQCTPSTSPLPHHTIYSNTSCHYLSSSLPLRWLLLHLLVLAEACTHQCAVEMTCQHRGVVAFVETCGIPMAVRLSLGAAIRAAIRPTTVVCSMPLRVMCMSHLTSPVSSMRDKNRTKAINSAQLGDMALQPRLRPTLLALWLAHLHIPTHSLTRSLLALVRLAPTHDLTMSFRALLAVINILRLLR